MSAADRDAVRRRHEALDAYESAALLNGAGLAYPERTRTMRIDDGKPIISDGQGAVDRLLRDRVPERRRGFLPRRTDLGFPRDCRRGARNP